MRGKWIMSAAMGAALASFGLPAFAQSADQPNNNTTQARLTPGAAANGELAAGGDTDWFRLTVQPGHRYVISLNGAGGEGTLEDPMLVLYSVDNSELARNDDTEEGLNSRLSYIPSSAGDVFLEARGFGDGATGAYVILAEEAAIPPDNAGNDATTGATIAAGQTVNGALEYGGDVDWFRVRVAPGQRYHFALNAASESGLDPVLVLHTSDGSEIAFNDDSAESLNSALDYFPSEETDLFVEARSFSEGGEGAYSLSVTTFAIPPDEAGNDATTRSRIAAGQSVSGALQQGGDVDWYRIAVRPGQRYTISLNSDVEAEFPLNDPLLRVIDANGEEVAVNDDGPEGLNSQLNYVPSARGNVFIEARGLSEGDAGSYVLAVEASALPADDATNGVNTRARLTPGASVTGALEYIGDSDWFRVPLEGGQAYRFSLVSGEGDNALADPMLRLRGPEGEEIAVDDDGGGGLNSYLEFVAPAAGNYFLEARGFVDDAEGAYVLSAATGDTPADMSTDASLSADGDYHEGRLSPAGDSDWYRIDMTAGQSVRIALDAAAVEGVPDPLAAMYGPDGAEVARDDDGGAGLNSWLEYTAAVDGPHYFEARGFAEESEGVYLITVTPGEIPASVDGAEQLLPNAEGRSSLISPGGDADWFAIELVEGRPYRFTLDGIDTDPLADPLLTLYDDQGNVVASDDDGGAGVNSYLTYVSITGGPYFAAVSSFDGASGGRYFLRVVDTDVPGHTATDEFLDATVADERASRIDMSGDLDFYAVGLVAGVRYEITLTGEGDQPLTDPFLTVLNSSGEQINSDDDGGPGLDSRLEFTPSTEDMYFLQASGLGGSTGGYRIAITRQ